MTGEDERVTIHNYGDDGIWVTKNDFDIYGFGHVAGEDGIFYLGSVNAPEMTYTEVPDEIIEFAERVFEGDVVGDTDELKKIRASMEG